MKVSTLIAASALASLLISEHAPAADELFRQAEPVRIVVTAGSNSDVRVYGAGALWTFVPRGDAARLGFDGRIAADLLWWHGSVSDNLLDASVTPYLRWRPAAESIWHRAFVQAGVGAHLLSRTSINQTRQFGTPFQFGSRFAVGFNFPGACRCEASLFVQHVSNAGITQPNEGLTFYGVTLGTSIE